MDSFTQRMMSRATSRKVELEQHLREILTADDDIDDSNFEAMLASRKSEYREILRRKSEDARLADSDDDDEYSEDKENEKSKFSSAAISDTTKSRLKKLIPLYTGGNAEAAMPSPVGYGRRQTEKELAECDAKAPPPGKYSEMRSKRLAHLADVINNWEDESDKKLPIVSRPEGPSAKPPTKPVSSPALKKKMTNFDKTENQDRLKQKSGSPMKKVVWDENVIETLEMQGFQRCPSDEHLVFDYKSPKKNPADCSRDVRPSTKKYAAPAPPSQKSPSVFEERTPKKYPAPVPPPLASNLSPRRQTSPIRQYTSPVKSNTASPLKFGSESPKKFCDPAPVTPKKESPKKTPQTMSAALMMETLPVKRIDPPSGSKMAVARQSSPQRKHNTGSAVLEMAAKYEVESTSPKKVRDPTELSIQARKAIFEKGDGVAILPKAPFAMAVPAKALINEEKHFVRSPERRSMPLAAKVSTNDNRAFIRSPERRSVVYKEETWKKETLDAKDSVQRSIIERQKEIEMLRTRWERKREENQMQGGPNAQFPPEYCNAVQPIAEEDVQSSTPSSPPSVHFKDSPTNKIRMGTRSPMRADLSAGSSPDRNYNASVVSPRTDQKLFSPPRSRRSSQDPASPRKSSEYIGSMSAIKKIRVSPPKAGRIYPSVSDIETESEAVDTEIESEIPESDYDARGNNSSSDESQMSLGQAVVQMARFSKANAKRGMTTSSPQSGDHSSSMDTSAQESQILHEIDDFLDEALGGASPPKRSRECPNTNTKTLQPSGLSGSCKSDSFEFQSTDEEQRKKTPLVKTVSTYRRVEAQKTMKLSSMEFEAEEALKNDTPEAVLIESKVFELQQEMIKQTTIISQATQALNLCHSRAEFTGSVEQVEAEKLLLLATSRRLAAQHELERLKVENTLKPGGMHNNVDKGDLTIQYISLPIKMCPTEPDRTDHFLCLVTSGTSVQATQVLALKKQNLSRGNRLAFTKPITLSNLYCDFTVTIEVHRLSCKNATEAGGSGTGDGDKDKKMTLSAKLGLTPQKKHATKRSHRMPIESPGGPNSVRSPSFKMVGFVVFSLRDVKKNKFTLNKVPYGAPLDGTIELSMSSALKSEVEYRGFLTQFQEVSGFGAWKRKWAHLKGSNITFWLYPEHEEMKKIPIDTLDLSTVRTNEVGLVSREICARPHTVLLETDSGEKILLAADTPDDRLAWTRAINKSLQLIRAWGGRAY